MRVHRETRVIVALHRKKDNNAPLCTVMQILQYFQLTEAPLEGKRGRGWEEGKGKRFRERYIRVRVADKIANHPDV